MSGARCVVCWCWAPEPSHLRLSIVTSAATLSLKVNASGFQPSYPTTASFAFLPYFASGTATVRLICIALIPDLFSFLFSPVAVHQPHRFTVIALIDANFPALTD